MRSSYISVMRCSYSSDKFQEYGEHFTAKYVTAIFRTHAEFDKVLKRITLSTLPFLKTNYGIKS